MATKHWTPAGIADLTGKTTLVTGANSGIGLETSRQLARHGARVILAGRRQRGLDEAVSTLRAENPNANLDTLFVDLGDLASVRRAAGKIAGGETVDLLINNAEIMNVPERRTTKDGFELTFGTNHLGHFAFILGVLPALRGATGARIVNVSAVAARWGRGKLVDLQSEKSYRGMTAYAKSKRANVVFTQELNRHLADTGIDAVVVHPGAAMTGLQRETAMDNYLRRALVNLMEKVLMGSPEGAAWPTLYAATNPAVKAGQWIGPHSRRQDSGTPKVVSLPRGADDPSEGASLWVESERLTGARLD